MFLLLSLIVYLQIAEKKNFMVRSILAWEGQTSSRRVVPQRKPFQVQLIYTDRFAFPLFSRNGDNGCANQTSLKLLSYIYMKLLWSFQHLLLKAVRDTFFNKWKIILSSHPE